MENKVSEYNIEVDYCNGVLLYNALTNKLLPVSFEDYTVIETLMESHEKCRDMQECCILILRKICGE